MPNDAFLSYSHRADFALAAAVEKGLEKLAKPLFSIRAMEVFRDESDLAASSGLTPALEKHLSQSRWLIVFASPTAARSAYCGDEVAWWVRQRGTDQLLIALTDGQIAWDRQRGDFDWSATDALPECLRGAFPSEPRYVDLREIKQSADLSLANPTFRFAMLDLAAPIRGIAKNQLDNEDVKRNRMFRLLVRAGVTAIALFGAAAAVMAVVARQQAQQSLSRQLSAQALRLVRAQPDLGLLLAVEALNIADSVEGRAGLLDALLDQPHLIRVAHGATRADLERQGFRFAGPVAPGAAKDRNRESGCEGGAESAAASADGKRTAYGCYSGDVRMAYGGTVRGTFSRFDHRQPVMSVLFSADGRLLISGGYDGRILLWDAASGIGMEPAFADNELPVLALALSADGRTLASLHEGGPPKLWDLAVRPRLKKPVAGVADPGEVLEVLGERNLIESNTVEWRTGDRQRLAREIVGPERAGQFLGLWADGKPLFAAQLGLSDAPLLAYDPGAGIALAVQVAASGSESRLLVRSTDPAGPRLEIPLPAYVQATAISRDGKRLAGAAGSKLWTWALPSGKLLSGPFDLEGEPRVLLYGMGDAFLAAGLADGRLLVLDPGSDKPQRQALDAHQSTGLLGIQTAALSADGKRVATGGVDGQILLWDTTTWQRRAPLQAYGFKVRPGPAFEGSYSVPGVAFGPDGALFAAATTRGPAIWFRGGLDWLRRGLDARAVSRIAFSPDSQFLITAGADGVLEWSMDAEDWKRRACAVANRNLSAAEWRQYVSFDAGQQTGWKRVFEPAYRSTCPERPAGAESIASGDKEPAPVAAVPQGYAAPTR